MWQLVCLAQRRNALLRMLAVSWVDYAGWLFVLLVIVSRGWFAVLIMANLYTLVGIMIAWIAILLHMLRLQRASERALRVAGVFVDFGVSIARKVPPQ